MTKVVTILSRLFLIQIILVESDDSNGKHTVIVGVI